MKINWGLGIAAVYVAFAMAIIFLVIVASRQKNDLVTENYYQQAVSYQDKIAAESNLMNASEVSVQYIPETGKMVVSAGRQLQGATGNMVFYRPDDAGKDFTIALMLDDKGQQELQVTSLKHGYWKLNISLQKQLTQYYCEKKIYQP
jgi:hypothetical protein